MITDKHLIFNTKINVFPSYEKVFDKIMGLTKEQPSYITVNNVHTIVESIKNDYYLKAINNSILSITDGKPLTIYAKLKGINSCERIFGPTLFENVLGCRHK